MRKKLKKLTAAVFAVCTIVTAAGCGTGDGGAKTLEGSCIDILNQVYETADIDDGLREAMSYYETTEVTEDREEYILGTDEVDYTDSAYSAPMMSSVAYQCVILRLEADEDVVKAKQLLRDKADPIKWICVEADSVVIESVGDVVLYIMADSATTEAVKTAFLALGE